MFGCAQEFPGESQEFYSAKWAEFRAEREQQDWGTSIDANWAGRCTFWYATKQGTQASTVLLSNVA